MEICHFGGMVECKTIDELSSALDLCMDIGVTSFFFLPAGS